MTQNVQAPNRPTRRSILKDTFLLMGIVGIVLAIGFTYLLVIEENETLKGVYTEFLGAIVTGLVGLFIVNRFIKVNEIISKEVEREENKNFINSKLNTFNNEMLKTKNDLVETIKEESFKLNAAIEKPILIRSDFHREVQDIVSSSKKTIFCLLRTSSIIGESATMPFFMEALQRGCSIKIVLCGMQKELVKQMAFEMDKETGVDGVMKKFGVFLEGYKNLKQVGKSRLEIRTINYLPSTLKFISDADESTGKGFIVPISFKRGVRKAPSILAIKANQGDILEYYIQEFYRYWEASEKTDIREAFDSTLNIENVKVRINSVRTMEDHEIEKMISVFNRYGWVILDLPANTKETPRDSLLDLKRFFGSSLDHNISDEDAITVIQQNNDPTKKIYKSQDNSPHPLHTGGTHTNNPQKIVALYCEIPSKKGGTTHIMSGKSAFQHLLIYNHIGLEELRSPDAVTFSRGDQSATKAIFPELENDRLSISFRKDDVATVEVKKEAQQAFDLLCKFRDNPKNRVEFNLRANQIYICDNTTVLHARTAFEENSARRIFRLSMNGISEYSDKLVFGFKEF